MTATPHISHFPLRPEATDLAEFASDFAALGSFTARDLAIQYLDANIDLGWSGDFDDIVEEFIPLAEYYTS